MFSCIYCDIFKNTYFEDDLQMAASAVCGEWIPTGTKDIDYQF